MAPCERICSRVFEGVRELYNPYKALIKDIRLPVADTVAVRILYHLVKPYKASLGRVAVAVAVEAL